MNKKGYIYFVIPILAAIAFGAYYWNFSVNYDRIQAEKVAAANQARELRLRQEAEMHQKAVDQAIADQERRKRERQAEDAKKQKEFDDNAAANQALDSARHDVSMQRDKSERLARQVALLKEDIARLNSDKADLEARQKGLQQVVQEAQSDTQSLQAVIEKINAADAAAAARAAAEAAAKKSSS